jgi:hypothetical protein
MGEVRNEHEIFLGTEWERHLLRLLCRREFNMKMDFKKVNFEDATGFICFRSVQKQAVMELVGP